MTLTESQLMALEMFRGEIPCGFTMTGDCEKLATWICVYEHVEPTNCAALAPMPVCDLHKEAIIKTSDPFWLMWIGNAEPIRCDCGVEVKIAEWRPLW